MTGLGTPDFGKLKTILSKAILPLPSTLGGLLSTLAALLGLSINVNLLP